jgi:hypothetical protein
MASQPRPFTPVTLECPRCKEKQVVHMHARPISGRQMGAETIECLKCLTDFDVALPDDIIAGPFPKPA